jgi:flagellar basal body-associated protein FliL
VSPWEIIGWAIAVPLIVLSVLFVFAVSVAVVRVTANRGKRRQKKTATKKPDLRAVK